jgi:DNA-binding CsgD family transcriptional regulator
MYWRTFRKDDLADCLDIQPACIGGEAALAVWTKLLESPAFQASVIESEVPIQGSTIVGCGMGVFVDRGFTDRELSAPSPGLNSRIISHAAAGQSVVLDRDAIAAGNAEIGLDFVNLYGTWRDEVLDDAQRAEAQTQLGTSFIENLAGFRFNRVLKEAIGQPIIEHARAAGTYRQVAEFPETDSALFVVDVESARQAPYSLAASMYRYLAPVLQLRPAEQELLAAALDGKTDSELSSELGISVEAVKKRWVSIYARIETCAPAIFAGAGADGTGRGPQKRHRVVAYARKHPAELRPYRWSDER